jgi:hypothetical protein
MVEKNGCEALQWSFLFNSQTRLHIHATELNFSQTKFFFLLFSIQEDAFLCNFSQFYRKDARIRKNIIFFHLDGKSLRKFPTTFFFILLVKLLGFRSAFDVSIS